MVVLLNPPRLNPIWTPASLTGLGVWLRADDIAGADGSAVASWVDRVGAHSFAQATGSKQPLLYTSTAARLIYGNPVVNFDGVDDILRYNGTIGAPTSGHIIIIGRLISLAVAGSGMFYASADEATATKFLNCDVIRPTSAINPRIAQQDGGTLDRRFATTTNLTLGAPVVVEWSSSGTAWSFLVNGITQSGTTDNGTNSGDWLGDTTARDNETIGAVKRTSEASFCNFDIAELIRVDDSTISAGDRSLLNTYIDYRYRIRMP